MHIRMFKTKYTTVDSKDYCLSDGKNAQQWCALTIWLRVYEAAASETVLRSHYEAPYAPAINRLTAGNVIYSKGLNFSQFPGYLMFCPQCVLGHNSGRNYINLVRNLLETLIKCVWCIFAANKQSMTRIDLCDTMLIFRMVYLHNR